MALSPRKHHLRWLFLAAICAGHCAARQVKTDLELEEAAKQAAKGEDSGWVALEKTVRATDAEPDLEMQKKALVEVGKIPSPRGVILLKENATNRNLRGEAIGGLAAQRNPSNAAEIDNTIVEASTKNAQQYGGLTRDEIKALGDSDHPDAVKLLKEQMGRDPNKDELAIDSLGKILKRRKKISWFSPQNAMAILGAANLSFDEEPTGAKPAAATPTSNASALPEAAPAPIADENDPESVLLGYLAGDGSADTKDRAVQSILAAHPPGVDYALSLASQPKVPLKARIALIDYLTRHAVNNQDRSIVDKFMKLRQRSARDAEFVASIDLSLRVLSNAFNLAIATPQPGRRTYRTVTRAEYERLEREADVISLKERPYPEYSGADVKTNLKKALRYYSLDSRLADRMQSHVSDLLNLPENRQSPERNLIFSALTRLAPKQDFYVLKKHGQDAFAKPGYFTTTLRLLTASARGRSWQIAALQRVWGLSYNEADKIRQIYLRDGRLLMQRMRL